MSTQDIATIVIAIATAINVIVTIGLAIATYQTALVAKKNSRADFLLRLDEAFLHHEDVREKLADGGDWHRRKNDPNFPKGPNFNLSEDLIAVSSYMGLFERIQQLIDTGIVDIDAVDGWYGDRLFNIVINPTIKDRLVTHKSGWSDFIKLWRALERRRAVSKRWLPKGRPLPDELFPQS